MRTDFSIGSSISFSRFLSHEKVSKLLKKLELKKLNAIELGLTNCVLGKHSRFGTLPYPNDSQVIAIKSIIPPEFNISIHGSYVISATTESSSGKRYSQANLTKSLKIAQLLEATHVTFHLGSFSSKSSFSIEKVRKTLKQWEELRQSKEYIPMLAPEVAGKKNGFADFFTLVNVVKQVGCLMTWDIAHDFARGANLYSEQAIIRRIETLEEAIDTSKYRIPVHLSGMIINKSGGEKQHTLLGKGDGVPWKFVLSVLKEQQFINKLNIICESKKPKGNTTLKGNSITDAKKILDFVNSNELVLTPDIKKSRLDHFIR